MKVKLILRPRFAKTWVHFDHFLVDAKTNKDCGYMRSVGLWGYGDPPFPSFRYETPVKYIASADKKEFRKLYLFCDHEVNINDFDKRSLRNFIDEQNVKHELEFVDVMVENPVYIDPGTGTVWKYREIEKDIYSKRTWYFKQMPNINVTPIWAMGDDWFYNLKNKNSKTAFLSGDFFKKLFQWKDDPRKFLYEKPKKDKQAIVKSLARQFKKISRAVKPLSEQTKQFFKLSGALKHLKTQHKKYAY